MQKINPFPRCLYSLLCVLNCECYLQTSQRKVMHYWGSTSLHFRGKGQILYICDTVQVVADLFMLRTRKPTNFFFLFVCLFQSSLLFLPTLLRETAVWLIIGLRWAGCLKRPERWMQLQSRCCLEYQPESCGWELINYWWNMQGEFKQRCVQWGFSGTCDKEDCH